MNLLNAFGLLNMINEGLDGYQQEYLEYINAHKERVEKFASWLKANCPEIFEGVDLDSFDEVIKEHDESKYSEEEFEPYAQRWHGDKKKTLEYEEAWKHHWMNNEHHPEYWLGEDMPYIYILEMICDWGSFSIASGDMNELSDFYFNKAKNDPEKNLSDNTKEIIEEILEKINSAVANKENLSEWVDKNGNKINLASKSSTKTNKEKFEALIDHFSRNVEVKYANKVEVVNLDDTCFRYKISHRPDILSYKENTKELEIRTNGVDSSYWCLYLYENGTCVDTSTGDGWLKLLGAIKASGYIRIPDKGTYTYDKLIARLGV